MDTKEMNRGVQLLLARMDSNPDEFTHEGWLANWSRTYDRYSEVLTPEERNAIDSKRTEVLREKFSTEIMSKLLRVEQHEPNHAFLTSQEIAQQMAKGLDKAFLTSYKDMIAEEKAMNYRTYNRYTIDGDLA